MNLFANGLVVGETQTQTTSATTHSFELNNMSHFDVIVQSVTLQPYRMNAFSSKAFSANPSEQFNFTLILNPMNPTSQSEEYIQYTESSVSQSTPGTPLALIPVYTYDNNVTNPILSTGSTVASAATAVPFVNLASGSTLQTFINIPTGIYDAVSIAVEDTNSQLNNLQFILNQMRYSTNDGASWITPNPNQFTMKPGSNNSANFITSSPLIVSPEMANGIAIGFTANLTAVQTVFSDNMTSGANWNNYVDTAPGSVSFASNGCTIIHSAVIEKTAAWSALPNLPYTTEYYVAQTATLSQMVVYAGLIQGGWHTVGQNGYLGWVYSDNTIHIGYTTNGVVTSVSSRTFAGTLTVNTLYRMKLVIDNTAGTVTIFVYDSAGNQIDSLSMTNSALSGPFYSGTGSGDGTIITGGTNQASIVTAGYIPSDTVTITAYAHKAQVQAYSTTAQPLFNQANIGEFDTAYYFNVTLVSGQSTITQSVVSSSVGGYIKKVILTSYQFREAFNTTDINYYGTYSVTNGANEIFNVNQESIGSYTISGTTAPNNFPVNPSATYGSGIANQGVSITISASTLQAVNIEGKGVIIIGQGNAPQVPLQIQ